MALGITMIYSVTKVANFASGELMVIGSYITIFVVAILKLPVASAFVCSFAFTALFAWFLSKVLYAPLIRRRTSTFMLFVATIATSMLIKNAIYLVIVRPGTFWLVNASPGVSSVVIFRFGDIVITDLFVEVLLVAAALVFFLQLFLKRTSLGKAMRATRDNPDLAWVTGVNVERVQNFAWAMAGGLSGLAGCFWAIYQAASPEIGWTTLWRAFAASVIGGLNSFSGTIVGGYIVGFSENFVTSGLYVTLGVPPAMKPVVTFGIMALAMLFLPTGLGEISWRHLGHVLLSKLQVLRKHVKSKAGLLRKWT